MPAESQKAMNITLNHAQNTFCFLGDIFIVLVKLYRENLALKVSKCEFFQERVDGMEIISGKAKSYRTSQK